MAIPGVTVFRISRKLAKLRKILFSIWGSVALPGVTWRFVGLRGVTVFSIWRKIAKLRKVFFFYTRFWKNNFFCSLDFGKVIFWFTRFWKSVFCFHSILDKYFLFFTRFWKSDFCFSLDFGKVTKQRKLLFVLCKT